MTTLTIGRFSMSDGPSAIRHDGDFLELELQIDAATTSTPAEAKVKRQQLLGMVDNPDEGAFPLTFSDDSDLDGFYSVLSVQCEPFEMFLNNGTMAASVSLRRVGGGYARPAIEVAYVMSIITNPHSVTERGRIAVPNEGLELTNVAGNLASTPQYITSESGSLALLLNGGSFPLGPVSGSMTYQVDPADFYDGAATIEVQIGATWYPVVGKQIPTGWTNWRLNNGWTRIGPTESGGAFYMLLEAWDGAAWDTVATFARAHYDTGVWTTDDFAVSNPRGVTVPGTLALAYPVVMRNDPATVTVKIPQLYGHEAWTLSRGDAFARLYYIDRSNSADNAAVQTSTTIAVTDSTAFMVRTTASGGYKFFVSVAAANTVDTTNGRIRNDVIGAEFSCAIGYSTPTTSTGIDEALVSLAATSQRQRVSAR